MKGWRKGQCKFPKGGVHYWRVFADVGDRIWTAEIEIGKTDYGFSSYEDWKYGNFFETKEKAEAAIREWVAEEAERLGIVDKCELFHRPSLAQELGRAVCERHLQSDAGQDETDV